MSAGANVKAVQGMLGHASASITLDVYADLFDDDLDAVAIALDKRCNEIDCCQSVATEQIHGFRVYETKKPGHQ